MNSTRFHTSPGYRELLAKNGLNSFEALFNYAAREKETTPSPYPLPSRERGEEEATPDGKRPLLRRLQTAHPPYITRFTLLDGAGVERTFVLKRETRAGLGRRPRSRSRKEWRNLVNLHDRGIAAAEPVALGERRRWGVARQAFILVREPAGTVSVAEYLQGGPEARERRELARELGGMIRRMHDGGLAYRDLYARHILIHPKKKDGVFGPTLVNAERAYRFPNLAPHFRWHDLAALLLTTNYPACTAADRLRVALAYGRQSRLSADLKVLIRRVVGRAARMRSRGLEPLLGLERLPLRMVALEAGAGQRAMSAERFVAELGRLGLGTFDAIMNYAGGKSYREAPGRLTVRVAATGPDGRASAFYLKRHEGVETREWLAGLVRRGGARTPGEVEFENVFRLALAGLAAPTPVAVGYERQGLKSRSFLITEELVGAMPADDYLKREFGAAPTTDKKEEATAAPSDLRETGTPSPYPIPSRERGEEETTTTVARDFGATGAPSPGPKGPPSPSRERGEETAKTTRESKPLNMSANSGRHGTRQDSRKRELVRQVGRLVRRFHRAGFYHRDLYLCHIFVREEGLHSASLGDAASRGERPSPGGCAATLPQGGGVKKQREERGRFSLYLIDLQRVRQKRPGRVGRRWLVKDLAALEYSAPAGVVTRTDRVRFLREYLGVKKLDGAAKELVKSVAAKAGRIARHDEKKR